MPETKRDLPHFRIEGGGQSESYTSPRTVISGAPPARPRDAHAARLEQALGSAIAEGRRRLAERTAGVAEGEAGFYLEFDIPAAERMAVEGLENKPKAIELVAVRPPVEGDDILTATVFVPEAAADFFVKKIEAYRDENTPAGHPKNQNLVARIEDVRAAVVRSLFTDSMELFPAVGQQTWWEVWLRDGRLPTFQTVAARLNVTLKPHQISFPERDVVLALADEATMARLLDNTDAIAELRIAKDTPTLFLEMRPVEQTAWALDLADRILPPPQPSLAVCLLDSGATQAHPLVAPALDPSDQHACDDAWGVGDSAYWNGHGTGMAGIALYGDLEATLAGGGVVQLTHGLETVKILPPGWQNEPSLYGAITRRAVSAARQTG